MNNVHAYGAAGFTEHLLPILPPDAAIHPDSPAHASLVASRGKVPGRKRQDGWMGFRDWPDSRATADDLAAWAGWGAGIGMQGRSFPGLDIDVDDPELAEAVHQAAVATLGDAPARFGRGSRRILVYAGDDFKKRRVAFRAAGGNVDPTDGSEPAPLQAVELLGAGQQYVVEGIHPKTEKPYYWRDGRSPADIGPAGLTVITPAKLDAFYDRLEGLLDLYGYEVVNRSSLTGGNGDVWQGGLLAPSIDAVGRALAAMPNEVDYDSWLKIGAAVKASAGSEREADAYELWLDWSLKWAANTPDTVQAKWDSLRPPFKVGWDWLARFATENGEGFSSADEDFDAIAEAPAPGAPSGPILPEAVRALFDRYVWAERLKRACDLTTGELLDRDQFNVRNCHIGHPAHSKDSAWGVFTSNSRNLRAVKSVTYRPGQGQFVTENLPGLVGPCVNLWKDPAPELPSYASDADVARWLDHVEFVVPDDRERDILLNWLAWIIQNPGEKPNWATVIGSTFEGLGKDLLLEPVRTALGAANVREITPEDLDSGYTWFLTCARLLIVEEMKLNDRKATMNRLKPLIAAPPYTLTVNVKYQPQYEVPNILAAIFFTNRDDALAISGQDRRYFVTWNDSRPRDDDYYKGLVSWYENGGAALAARWLLDRDISGFDAKGRAPETEAKGNMRKASRSAFDETLEEMIADCEGPFEYRLVSVDDVAAVLQSKLGDRPRLTNHRVASALRRLAFQRVDRVSLRAEPSGSQPKAKAREEQVYARADDLEVHEEDKAGIRRLYWADRVAAGAANAEAMCT